MTDIEQIGLDLQSKESKKARHLKIEAEDNDATFLADWTRSISKFGSSGGGQINLIRDMSSAAMGAIQSVFSIQNNAFNTIKSGRDSVMGVFDAIRDLMLSVMALDRQLIYQLQRASAFKFQRTLGALGSACHRIRDAIEGLESIADVFDKNAFNFDELSDDWSVRVELARKSLDKAERDGVISDSWKTALDQLDEMAEGGSTEEGLVDTFREFVNSYEELNRAQTDFATLKPKLEQHLQDEIDLISGLKGNLRFNELIVRAIKEARRRVKDASSSLEGIKGGCRFNPEAVLSRLSSALGSIDAARIVLRAADGSKELESKDGHFNFENIDIDSPCGLVALEAYIDDLAFLQSRSPDFSAFSDEMSEYKTLLLREAVVGNSSARGKRKSKGKSVSDYNDRCRNFSVEANRVHGEWLNDPLSNITQNLISPLAAISQTGDAVDDVFDYMLNAKIFRITSYQEFLKLFPAGRLYLLVVECLGLADLVDDSGAVSAGSFEQFDWIKGRLGDLTGDVDKITSGMAKAMGDAFRWLGKIDTEVAEFISAIVSLLYFCSQQQGLTSLGPNTFSLTPAPGIRTTNNIYKELYNDGVGSGGKIGEDLDQGPDEDACRC